jgi:hypothetical protein
MLYLFSKKMVTFPIIARKNDEAIQHLPPSLRGVWQSIICKNNIVNNKPNCFLIYIFGLFYVVFWIASSFFLAMTEEDKFYGIRQALSQRLYWFAMMERVDYRMHGNDRKKITIT